MTAGIRVGLLSIMACASIDRPSVTIIDSSGNTQQRATAASCRWDACECIKSAPIERGEGCTLSVAITYWPNAFNRTQFGRAPIWQPLPDGYRLVQEPGRACLHLIVKTMDTPWNQRSYRSRGYPHLGEKTKGRPYGRNTVFVDL